MRHHNSQRNRVFSGPERKTQIPKRTKKSRKKTLKILDQKIQGVSRESDVQGLRNARKNRLYPQHRQKIQSIGPRRKIS